MESYEDMMMRHGDQDYWDASDLEASDTAVPETGRASTGGNTPSSPAPLTANEVVMREENRKPSSFTETPHDWPHILSILRVGRIPPDMADIIRHTLDDDASGEGWKLYWGPERHGGDKDKRMKLILRRFVGEIHR